MKCPTKEQIKKAAETNPEAKTALEALFPEYFADEKYYDLTPLFTNGYDCFHKGVLKRAGLRESDIQIRASGPYSNKGFFLNPAVTNWEIIKESSSVLILLPTKKTNYVLNVKKPMI